jgi:hypothetical protein
MPRASRPGGVLLRTLLPFALAVIGIAKAGAAIAIGLALELSPLLVSIAAALWVTGPTTVAWLWADRKKRRAQTPAPSSS